MTADTATRARVAFYALAPGGWRDYWTLLHPPYTVWHLSYVGLGAAVASNFHADRLAATALAFFLAVGITAHALDELHGHPLRTRIPSWQLGALAIGGLTGAVVLGSVGVMHISWGLLPFMLVGAATLVGYTLEWGAGRLHTDICFAAAWGAFPVLTAAFAQTTTFEAPPALAAAAAFLLALAQRRLSTRARFLRRRVRDLSGHLTLHDGRQRDFDLAWMVAPIDAALLLLSLTLPLLVAALLAQRLL